MGVNSVNTDNKTAFSSSAEEFLKMSELDTENLQTVLPILKEQSLFYQAQVTNLEKTLMELGLMDEHSEVCEEHAKGLSALDKLGQVFPDVKDISASALSLAYASKLNKQNNNAAKMKSCLKMYLELNGAMSEKITKLKSEYQQAQEEVDDLAVSESEIKSVENKIAKYQQELLKMEKKYPWLLNKAYDLSSISKEINELKAAQKEKEDLVQELSHFHGLKPDLVEASEQLAQLKLEHQRICAKLN